MTKTVGIIGYGYVGKAMYEFFQDHYKTIFYDPYVQGSCTKDDINQTCDLAVICVPTPMDYENNNQCDISLVEETMEWLKVDLILLKSTVEIGTTDRLIEKYDKSIVFSPEFCGESKHWTHTKFTSDVKETPFFIFGGRPKACSMMISYFMPVVGPDKTYRSTTAIAAEVCKYMENTFFGLKVTFCYEMDQICKAVDTDFNEVRDLWLLDPRVNKSHTGVFLNNEEPYGLLKTGSKCLEKDINALYQASLKKGYDAKYIKAIIDSNLRLGDVRRQQKKKDNDIK